MVRIESYHRSGDGATYEHTHLCYIYTVQVLTLPAFIRVYY